MNNEQREQQMMDAADRYADEVCDESCTGAQEAETINDFCAGWRAADNSKWIPVEESLPKVGEKVIFYSLGLDDWMAGAIQSDGRWWSDEYASHFTDVTIWMKPQPPQGKEE